MFKALVFDLDGTLINSLADIADTMNLVLKESGFPEHSEAFYRPFIGLNLEQLVAGALPRYAFSPELQEEALAAYRRIYVAQRTVKTRPYPQIQELLLALNARQVPISILTNKKQESTEEIVRQLFPAVSFERIIGVTPERKLKPNPESALALVKESGIPAEQWLFVGDTEIDMATAIAAGMCPLGVAWGYRDEIFLYASGAQKVIKEPLELLAIL